MDQAFIDSQFSGLVERNWTDDECVSLVASIWQAPEPTAAELELAAEMEEYALGASIVVFGPAMAVDVPVTASGSKVRGRHRKPRKGLFLPVLRILKGEA